MPSARYAKLDIDVGENLILKTADCALSLGCLFADRRILLQSADIHIGVRTLQKAHPLLSKVHIF